VHTIQKHELVAILRTIADYIEERAPEQVPFDKGYYWDLNPEIQYDVGRDPMSSEFEVGDLTHDWERLQQILVDKDMIVPSSIGWTGDVLRALGSDQRLMVKLLR
jgi:hypothetical protein